MRDSAEPRTYRCKPERPDTNFRHSNTPSDMSIVPARLNIVQDAMRRFPDLPPEVFFKEDLLRLGICLGMPGAGRQDQYQKKSYFIFSFDRTPIDQMASQENL